MQRSAMHNKQVAPSALPDLNKIKGILFDIDGTLTNSDPLHFKACVPPPLTSGAFTCCTWCGSPANQLV